MSFCMFSLLPHSPAERPAQGAKSKIWLFQARFRGPGSQSLASRPGRTLIVSPPRDGPACQQNPMTGKVGVWRDPIAPHFTHVEICTV